MTKCNSVADGRFVKMSDEEFKEVLVRWQNSPRCKAICAQIEAERRKRIDDILAGVKVQKTK